MEAAKSRYEPSGELDGWLGGAINKRESAMRHARSDYNRIQDPAGIIPEDEPVFLLRGQDSFAPQTVHLWATLVEKLGGDPDIVKAAQRWVLEMQIWQRDHGSKTPDMPAP